MNGHFDDLSGIARLDTAVSRSVSAENPDGAKGGGARAAPGDDAHCTDAARKLGKGWKVRPCLRDIAPGATVTLADVTGPGIVEHVWCTVDPARSCDLTLRVAYDGRARPSIEVPLAHFFANGIDGRALVTSIPIAVNPRGGLNSYWPMPFRRHLRMEIRNDGATPVPELFYQLTCALGDVPDDAAYLHAEHRRATTTREQPEHVILARVEGRGRYVGTVLVWRQHAEGWWGEGEVKFFVDGDAADAPTICGTGTEDYFGGAWGFEDGEPRRPVCYSGPYLGYPQRVARPDGSGPGAPLAAHGLYRWHVPDPIRFRHDLRVTVQTLGWWPDGTYQPLVDDLQSVALWYQALPVPSPSGGEG